MGARARRWRAILNLARHLRCSAVQVLLIWGLGVLLYRGVLGRNRYSSGVI